MRLILVLTGRAM